MDVSKIRGKDAYRKDVSDALINNQDIIMRFTFFNIRKHLHYR